MSIMNKISFVTLFGMILLFNIRVAISATTDIAGIYRCSGSDPMLKDPNFEENIEIKKNGDTYKVEFYVIDGAIPFWLGTAITNKNINNVFSLLYWDPNKPDTRGIELVVIKPDGSLNSVFADANRTVTGHMTCKRIKSQ